MQVLRQHQEDFKTMIAAALQSPLKSSGQIRIVAQSPAVQMLKADPREASKVLAISRLQIRLSYQQVEETKQLLQRKRELQLRARECLLDACECPLQDLETALVQYEECLNEFQGNEKVFRGMETMFQIPSSLQKASPMEEMQVKLITKYEEELESLQRQLAEAEQKSLSRTREAAPPPSAVEA